MSLRLSSLLVALLILSIIGNTVLVKKTITLSDERRQLVQAAQDSGRIAHTYLNLHGLEVSKNKALELDLRNAQDLHNIQALSFTKEFSGVKKNLGNLEEALRIQSQVIIGLKLKTGDTLVNSIRSGWFGSNNFLPRSDSGKVARSFKYKDKFNSFSGLVFNDSSFISGTIDVPIKEVRYWQRKHYFIFKNWRYGRKEEFTEMYSDNPWVHITNHELVTIKK